MRFGLLPGHSGKEDKYKLSIYGGLLFLIFVLGGIIILPKSKVFFLLGYVALITIIFVPHYFKLLFRPRILIFLFLIIVINGLIDGGEKKLIIWKLALSKEGLLRGSWMAARAISIILAVFIFTGGVSLGELLQFFNGLGLPELGFTFGLALNLLPLVQRVSNSVFTAMRLRGGFRRNRWRSLRLLLITIIVNILRYGEDIVCAAETRAFTGKLNRAPLSPPTLYDLVLLISTLSASIIIILL